MSNNQTDTEMARLVRIETKLSVFMQETKTRFSAIESKIDKLQQSFDEVYPEELEQWTGK